jgi:hypothetical protein
MRPLLANGAVQSPARLGVIGLPLIEAHSARRIDPCADAR